MLRFENKTDNIVSVFPPGSIARPPIGEIIRGDSVQQYMFMPRDFTLWSQDYLECVLKEMQRLNAPRGEINKS